MHAAGWLAGYTLWCGVAGEAGWPRDVPTCAPRTPASRGPAAAQGVHMLFEGMPDRPWKEGELRVSKMVFIGKDLDRALIEEGFRECIVKE